VDELKAIALKGIVTDSFDWELMRQKLGIHGKKFPIVILLQCKRAVYPFGASRDVLLGKTPFTLIDDTGVHFFEAKQSVTTRRMSQLIQVKLICYK
jgi:hypothetical protein